MPIRIHSLETYLDKYVLPIVFIPWAGFGSLSRAFPGITPVQTYLLIALCALFAAVVFWHALKLKTVILDDEVLHVAGYLKQVTIPLSDVMNIRSRLFLRPHWTIELRTPTEFGDKVMFLPKTRISTSGGSKSTFAELQARIERARS
jgi:hypothetical protein